MEVLVEVDAGDARNVDPRARIALDLVAVRRRVLIPCTRAEDAVLRSGAHAGDFTDTVVLVHLIDRARASDRRVLATLVLLQVLVVRIRIRIRLGLQLPAVAELPRER